MIRDERASAPRPPRPRGQEPAPHQPASANPATAYGPDDPAYGPPTPDWYARQDAARQQQTEAELQQARGPFEPLPPDHVVPDAPEPEPEPEPEVDISLAGQGTGPPLERIKDLYATAEAVGDYRLDEHFEQLLARQRQLIMEYFTESESRTSAGLGGRPGSPEPQAASDGADRPAEPDMSLRGARRGQR